MRHSLSAPLESTFSLLRYLKDSIYFVLDTCLLFGLHSYATGTIRPEFGDAVSGRSSAKVINTDHQHAAIRLSLSSGVVAGDSYTFSISARVSPSIPTPVGLQLLAQNTTLCGLMINGCALGDLMVLGSGNATKEWVTLSWEFVSPLNATVIYLAQAQAGTIWLDDATLH